MGSAPPQAEKSFVIAMDGAFVTDGAFGRAGAAGAGSGVDQASFEPQASELENPVKLPATVLCEVTVFLGKASDGG